MIRQHRWTAKWDNSDSVDGATVKSCEDCGAELIAIWTEAGRGFRAEGRHIASLVYVEPCAAKP